MSHQRNGNTLPGHPRKKITTGNEQADRLIDDLLALYPEAGTHDLVEEIITFTLRLLSDRTSRGEVKILRTSLKEFRHAFRVFAEYRGIRKATIFGSARVPEDDPCFLMAVAFAKEMAARGWMTITGAGPGIMQAGNEGAGRERSFGINIMLPFEQESNPVIEGDPKHLNLKYFFTRKLIFLKESHALTLFPGGFGTFDECFEVLTLVQTGKAEMRPIVLLSPPGDPYWDRFNDFLEENLHARGYLSPHDRSLYRRFHRVEDAVEEICRFYRVYHSLRYVDEDLVLRLQSPLPAGALDSLNRDFPDILDSGRIEATGPHPEEVAGGDFPDLPRLTLRFNRRDYGRLRELIDRVNLSS